MVESICLLIEVAEQMKRLDTDVGSIQTTLEQRPKVFQPVGVNLAVYVLDGVVDHLVLKLIESFVRLQGIRV